MTQAISKSESQQHQQQLQHQRQASGEKCVQERNASASASVRFPLISNTILIAGLNLNLFGALSGAFSSKKTKTTHNNADGSSVTHEESHDKAGANAAARANGSAYGAAHAQERSLKSSQRGAVQEQGQGREVVSKKVDHLGIEG
ncbi:hypothetical protein PtrCC142_007218 [Pyrenophora tritici-repentis]|uniref:Uncharacterized protein n=2 Tax=Pyrenophora tritici-repentis TaxID=45151 RepID=A0A2W1DD89_9PLEO|nr:uncharacterized protein PTRG_06625 [Pyrenophora tritici-repentis Pt-1C-BFP]KAI1512757.1 hypothetical protein Ptr86124_008723 [Pyrenophora tritici-repentis]EDU49545.1 predicted protein [Pyrenophora tritici-repentis Pt-1C-BFP]KAI1534964.1 hypothetical protein PtrSN001C_007056 [Pyrenophora tritici-repentis]KAI1540014.1 hypothetical protein PtrSN001A_004351 [Pyrenophora tritici-repentis]KAI1599718.1 hypothetical protein PtrCC142_007218 [Pyrenophora tritici-repentis]